MHKQYWHKKVTYGHAGKDTRPLEVRQPFVSVDFIRKSKLGWMYLSILETSLSTCDERKRDV